MAEDISNGQHISSINIHTSLSTTLRNELHCMCHLLGGIFCYLLGYFLWDKSGHSIYRSKLLGEIVLSLNENVKSIYFKDELLLEQGEIVHTQFSLSSWKDNSEGMQVIYSNFKSLNSNTIVSENLK